MALGMFLSPSPSLPRPTPPRPPRPLSPDPSLVLSSVPRLDHHPHPTSYPTPSSPSPSPSPLRPHPTTLSLPPTPPSPTLPANPSTPSPMNPNQHDTNNSHYTTISQGPLLNPTPPVDEDSSTTSPSIPLPSDVDPQILEALKSKDRIYVLKLGETFEALIMERKTRVELTPTTSYQRLLVHRCSAYYKLAPESDPVTKAIFVLFTADSRIPDRRICELVPAEATTQPSFKIMRRSVQDRRSKPHSHAGSVAGEDGDLSDPEPSESGSLGGRSNITSSSTKKRMTIEEREAAYNEARSRIFMNFEEKEKNKEKDMSASSSSLSLNGSASTSAGGRSSIGDTDDAASSPATESEWSVPSGSNNSRDRKDIRRGGPPSVTSNRSLRSGGSFHANGSGGSSRNSRAPSPSFNYASLHDNAPGHIYDPAQHNLNPNMGYYPPPYYAYSPSGPGPSPPFMPPYPYYQAPYNPYQPPPPPPVSSDPTTPSGPEAYSPQHPMGYRPPYGWPTHPNQPALQSPPPMPIQPQQPQQNPPHPLGPPQMQPQSPQYQPFVHPSHAYPYPMNAYYPHMTPQPLPPPGQQMPPPLPPPPHMNNIQTQQPPPPQHHQPQQQPQQHGYDIPRVIHGNPNGHTPPNGHYNGHNGNGSRNGVGNGVIPPNNNNNNNGRANVRNGGSPSPMNNSTGVNGGKHRSQMPPTGRAPWSFGPGVGNGGYTTSMGSAGNEAVGPRFQTHRHVSGNSSSGNNSRSSLNDEVSSTSSSTTSSSSRRTYTSTTSSQQHPLPARPDWAVGLKAQPTLAAMGSGRHHDHSLNNSRTMSPISPPRANGHHSPSVNGNTHHGNSSSQYAPPISLQATDFPPLTSNGGNPVPEKRTPVVSGAWGQSRPILSTPATNGANSPSVASSAQQSPVIKNEDGPKTSETINGKTVRRPTIVNGQVHHRSQSGGKDVATAKGDTVAGAITVLAGQVCLMSLEGKEETMVEPSAPNINEAATAMSPATVAPGPSV